MAEPKIGSLAKVSFDTNEHHPYIVTQVSPVDGTMKHTMDTTITDTIERTSDGWKVTGVDQNHKITFQNLPAEITSRIRKTFVDAIRDKKYINTTK